MCGCAGTVRGSMGGRPGRGPQALGTGGGTRLPARTLKASLGLWAGQTEYLAIYYSCCCAALLAGRWARCNVLLVGICGGGDGSCSQGGANRVGEDMIEEPFPFAYLSF